MSSPVTPARACGSSAGLAGMIALWFLSASGLGCSTARSNCLRTYPLPRSAQSMEIPPDAPLDPALQSAIEELDHRIGNELGIPPGDRAIGVLDLGGPRLAMINQDKMFYGASVPKIAIVFAYLLLHPEVAADPPRGVMHDLQAVIKRSDNELAAKYSRLTGLERIQQVLTSPQYHFYDQEHGGGLWCGKHYGAEQPRTGDPLRDLSHAATVRQCLRFYLMLEQDRLGNPMISRRLREVFAAPWAEFHDDYFVAGMRGLGLTMIRKNGQWEDWHLDTARIELPDRPILLAGIVRHERGPDYLARMARGLVLWLRAAGTPEAACAAAMKPPEEPWRLYRHETILHELPSDFAHGILQQASLNDAENCLSLDCRPSVEAAYESPPIETEIKFNELLLSWNVQTPPETGFSVEIQVGRRFDGSWSPWLYIGDWGEPLPTGEKLVRCEFGEIKTDSFVSTERFDRFRYRLRGATNRASGSRLLLRRIAACVSDLTGLPDSWAPPKPALASPPPAKWQRRLCVPFRGQFTERPELAGRICSPTSVSMVLAYRGVDRTTLQVVDACYDPAHDIYGNWPRNLQAAFSLGAPGYLTRFSNWTEVEQSIAKDCPVIASICFDKPGVIAAAPYATTDGHLLVICGFDAYGNVEVNDSAVRDPAAGMLKYAREDMAKAWFGGSGGVAYVLLPPERQR